MVRAELAALGDQAKHRGVKFIRVQGDSQMRPGDCLLESPIGSVDASLDEQLAAIIKIFDDPARKSLRFRPEEREKEE